MFTGELTFTTTPRGLPAPHILSPVYWPSSAVLSKCYVQFNSRAVGMNPIGGRLAIYKFRETRPLWEVGGKVLAGRIGQHYTFNFITKGSFQVRTVKLSFCPWWTRLRPLVSCEKKKRKKKRCVLGRNLQFTDAVII